MATEKAPTEKGKASPSRAPACERAGAVDAQAKESQLLESFTALAPPSWYQLGCGTRKG